MSASTQNQAFNALLFLYREVLEIEFGDFRNTIRAKQRTRISVVLSKEEIRESFSHVSGIHALMLKLIYAGGMRLTEYVRLRIKDLDFDNQTLVIRSGKGDKDRTTLFPPFLYPPINAHLKEVKALHDHDLYPYIEAGTLRRRESGGIFEMTGTGRHLKHLEIF